MVGAKRPGVFPLRVSDLVSFPDRDPAILANGHAGTLIRFVEPGNYARRFRAMARRGLIIVRKCAIKWILARREFHRNIILSARGVRIIEAAIAFRPFFVPGTCAIRYRIVFGRLFANPENRGHNLTLPRVLFAR